MSEKDVILKVENISKLYRLGTVGTGTFGGDVQRFWKTKILGQEDPFMKIGQTNDRTSKGKVDFVWALQDINFEVKRGEVLGIIGKNGAGKSTLLKLLSRITSPTTGSIKSAGRMASLLEVGTGFHPELTGRENIFLNGAILGMTKKEIQSKFDEIVDFSGCELYIDTPTKRYSSGMTVRLGFAVAAFLDPEILIVDEVLAVGDAEFQKKAIGKMKEVSAGGGRTVLFVSHNMDSILSLCNTALVMNNGKIINSGKASEMVRDYLAISDNQPLKKVYQKFDSHIDVVAISKIELTKVSNGLLKFEIEVTSQYDYKETLRIGYSVNHIATERVLGTYFTQEVVAINNKKGNVTITLNLEHLVPDKYSFSFSVGHGNENMGLRDYDVVIAEVGIDLRENLYDDNIVKWDFHNWGLLRIKPEQVIV
jgi:lipopolysaccharide transport system ATP-binding protein